MLNLSLLAERYCLGFSERQLLGSVVLRFFNVYGPRQGMNDYSGVITRFIEFSKKGLPLVIYGDGSQTRDFVNVKDVVEAVLASMKNSKAVGEVFNIGSGKPTSINELAKAILDLTGLNLEILMKNLEWAILKIVMRIFPKLRNSWVMRPMVSLRDGLRILLEEKTVAT